MTWSVPANRAAACSMPAIVATDWAQPNPYFCRTRWSAIRMQVRLVSTNSATGYTDPAWKCSSTINDGE